MPAGTPAARLPAAETKATSRPSPEIDGAADGPSAAAPVAPAARLASVVVPAKRSRTYTAGTPGGTSASDTRPGASETKATRRPSAEMTGSVDVPRATAPVAPLARLTRVVQPISRSRTYTLATRETLSADRFLASDTKATRRPSPDSDGATAEASADGPRRPARETSVVSPGAAPLPAGRRASRATASAGADLRMAQSSL